MTAIGVLPASLATLCSMRKNMYSSYSSLIRWKEPKLAALRSVRSRITMELKKKKKKSELFKLSLLLAQRITGYQ